MKAALFDLDGTLIDSDEAIVWCVNALLDELGRPPASRDEIVELIGVGLTPLLARFLPDPEVHVAEYHRLYLTGFATRTKILTGASELLSELRRRNIPAAIVTNRNRGLAVDILRGVGLFEYFDDVLGEGDGFPLKPDPAVVIAACTRLGVGPADAWYIGDTDIDVAAGLSAGCQTILVAGVRNTNQAAPDVVVRRLDELIEKLPADGG